jgi:hypothetical protein
VSGILTAFIGRVANVVTDAYFNLVTLLLPGNGTNGAQNNTFLDSSTNTFTITRNGNTTQGTFSPFSQTGWSNFFDGTDDYLSVADNAVLRPGAGTFTLEAWIYRSASGAAHTIYAKGGASTGIVFQVTSTNVLRFTHTTTNIDSTGTISANAWTHVAVVREGTGTNQTKLYINGTQDGQGTVSTDFTQTEEVRIGTNRGATEDFNGYISNLRFTKGAALYTGNFTPSTSPLTTTSQGASATDVELLTCQSNRFVDNSSNAFAITVNGTPSVQAFSPFAPTDAYSAATVGGSGYFDGTGDYLTIASSANFTIGSNNFTVEAWIYITGGAGTQREVIVRHNPGSSLNWMLELTSGNLASFYFSGTGGGESISSDASVPLNQWVHIAGGINGANKYVCLNGVYKSAAYSSAPVSTSTLPIVIGAAQNGTLLFTGYIASPRVVNGTAVYTANYTVPTAPFTAIANTQLLLNYTNAAITDATAKNDLETVGNAQISTTQSKFGGSSMYFDGNGDYLQLPSRQTFAMGSGNWTVEMWLYPNSVASLQGLLSFGSGSWRLFQNSQTVWFLNGAGSIAQTGNVFSTGQWYHIAVVKNGTTITIYVNGVSSATGTDSNTYAAATAYIGSEAAGSYLNGFIDDLRVTRGFARYTANFTAPTAAFPTQ